MRGVSAIIAVILILMIVVAIAGITYLFSSRIFTSTTSSTQRTINQTTRSLMANMKVESMSLNNIYIRNIGQSDLTGFSVYINDEPADFNIVSPIVKPGDVGVITITDFIKEDDEIRITNAQGIITSKKVADPCRDAVLCLNMNEGSGATTYDSAGHTGNNGVFYGESFNDGTINGTSRVDGKFGKALNFDGTDDYAEVNKYFSTSNTSPIAISAWINPIALTYTTDWHYYFGLQGCNSGITHFADGTIKAEFRNKDCNISLYNVISNPQNKWYHVVWQWSNGVFQVYVDGNLTINQSQPTHFNWGRFVLSTLPPVPGSGGYVNASVDEVRIYNRSLTIEEIQAEMQSPTPIIRTVSSYSFEESGQYLNDTHIWVKGKSGSALDFDGINDYVEIADNVNLKSSSFTIEFLAYPKGSGAWNRWMGKNNYTVPREGWVLLWTGPTADRVYLVIFNSTSEVTSQYVPISLNEWVHLAFTVDNNTKQITVFKNGQQYSTPISYTSWNTSNVSFSIGRADSTYFNGTIDEVRIYNKAIY